MTSEPCAGSLQALLNYWMPMHTSLVLGSVGRRSEKLMEDDATCKRGKPFAPGNRSGKGRPTGSRNKVTLACEDLLEGEAGAITHKVIEMAKEGDHVAMKLCMERIYPPRRQPGPHRLPALRITAQPRP